MPDETEKSRIPLLDPLKQALFTPAGPVADRTFELGLVLGGTVSAGAYTAGALDLLIEALDRFHKGNPSHTVKLRLAAGSSGGAVCSAILALSVNKTFRHVNVDQAALVANAEPFADNKLYDIWVNQLQISEFLDTSDLHAELTEPSTPPYPDLTGPPPKEPIQHVHALLNSQAIDKAVESTVAYANGGGLATRVWAASPFRVATTVCNLRGVPYRCVGVPEIGAFRGTAFVEHDDFAWFVVPNVEGTGDGPSQDRRPDEFWLSLAPVSGITEPYQTLGDFARASGAMPLGLPARHLSRPAEHYAYRPTLLPGQTGLVWPQPHWDELKDVLAGNPYTLTAVDGGTLNNDPVKIARQGLYGYGESTDPLVLKQNSAEKDKTKRALLLIDPLADQPTSVDPVGISFMAVAGEIVGTLVGGARYLTADLDMFKNRDTFNRFQLVPTRLGLDGKSVPGDLHATDKNGLPAIGEQALAGTDLFAMAGWCQRDYRVHDFMLGRHNMAAYLKRELILSANNTLFDGWTDEARKSFAIKENGDPLTWEPGNEPDRSTYFLPIIPVRDGEITVLYPDWPKNKFDPSDIEDDFKKRVSAVAKALRSDNFAGFWPWLGSLIGLGAITDSIVEKVFETFRQDLQDKNLI